jgi:hypothetical protein
VESLPVGATIPPSAASPRRSLSNSNSEPAAKIGQKCRSHANDAAMDRSTAASGCRIEITKKPATIGSP